jgi:hypothetical protein
MVEESELGIKLHENANLLLSPEALGFLPPKKWVRIHEIAFRSLVMNYFRARSSRKIRFEHKLWNALAISRHIPDFAGAMGVAWESSTIFRVDKDAFGELLAVTKPGSAFFSQRGSLNSHGFREVSVSEAQREAPFGNFSDVDELRVRLYRHAEGRFRSDSLYQDVDGCSWARVY